MLVKYLFQILETVDLTGATNSLAMNFMMSALYSRRRYGQNRHFSAGALGLLLGFLYDRMECPEHSDSIGDLLEPPELVL